MCIISLTQEQMSIMYTVTVSGEWLQSTITDLLPTLRTLGCDCSFPDMFQDTPVPGGVVTHSTGTPQQPVFPKEVGGYQGKQAPAGHLQNTQQPLQELDYPESHQGEGDHISGWLIMVASKWVCL